MAVNIIFEEGNRSICTSAKRAEDRGYLKNDLDGLRGETPCLIKLSI